MKRHTCYFCGGVVVDGVGHAPFCPTWEHHMATPLTSCDCGSPDAHWQFCVAFKPYEDRDDA